MALSTSLEIEIGGFKSNITQAQSILKGLNAEMKSADAEFKATGNAEQLLANKTKTLNSQLNVQKGIVDQASAALKKMDASGIQPTEKAYQQMYATMMNAQAGMYETQAAIDALGASASGAAGEADQLTNSVNGISKKMSLDQVISGLDTIKRGLESAARAAVDLGKQIWENITDTARYSDDIATQAMVAGMDIVEFQKYKGVFDTVGEITVQEWMKAQNKVKNAIYKATDEQQTILDFLGVSTYDTKGGGIWAKKVARNAEDVFWDIGKALTEKVESGAMTQDLADTYANALFGKGFAQLKPMFSLGKEGFAAALKDQAAASEEAIQKNAELNDKLITLENTFNALKVEVTKTIAPALTDVANSLNGVLKSVLDYLQTPEGQEALAQLGDSISGLFGDLSEIDPEKVVSGFVDVFTQVTDGIKWIVDNAETAKGILATVVGAWGVISIGENVLKVFKFIDGIQGLGSGAGAAGAAAGASWGSAFAGAVAKAAPWLIGLYTLLNPAGTGDELGNNTLIDENGNLTAEAEAYGFGMDAEGNIYQDRREAIAQAVQDAWDKARTNQFDQAALEELRNTILNDDMFSSLMQMMYGMRENPNWKEVEDLDLSEWLQGFDVPEVTVEPVAPSDAAAKLSGEIGTVPVGVQFVWGANGQPFMVPGHANGIHYVPNDGLRYLHRGEQVVPAREVQSRNFSSNLYVENMNMNGGLSADALAAAIANRNRRVMTGYGS